MTVEPAPSVANYAGRSTSHHCTAIPATCQPKRGPVHDATLMVSQHNRMIVLDPQVSGACVMSLGDNEAKTLPDLLTVWLR